MQSSLSRIDRNVWMLSCKVLKIEDVLWKIEMDSEAATARVGRGGGENESSSIDTLVTSEQKGETRVSAGNSPGAYDHGRSDTVKLGETTTGSSNSSEGEGFVKDETAFVLVLEFDL